MRFLPLIGALMAACFLASCGQDRATIQEVRQLTEARNYDQALQVLQKGLRENPKSKPLLREQVMLFLKTEQVPYAITAYRKLTEHSPDDDVLRKALKHKDSVIRITAAKALGLLKDTKSIDALIAHARDPEKSVRQAIVLALGDIKDRKALPVLIQALADEDWYVRAEAALALGKVGDAQAASKLFELLNDSDSYVRQNARKALQELATAENKSVYTAALQNSDPAIRTMAAVALANTGDAQGVDILIEALQRPESSDLIDVIRAVVKIKDPKTFPAVRKTLDSPSANIRALGALALGELGDADSIGRLKALATDKSQPGNVRTAALLALNKLGAAASAR
jgi:HEAT repeat protein